MSILPISKDTICYGSNDAGQKVLSSIPEHNASMEAAAKKLNIKGHYCGMNSKTFLYGPCDIEGHVGYDNRFYVIGTKE